MTKSFPEDPMVAGILCPEAAISSHESTKFCTCSEGSTGCPMHLISTYKKKVT